MLTFLKPLITSRKLSFTSLAFCNSCTVTRSEPWVCPNSCIVNRCEHWLCSNFLRVYSSWNRVCSNSISRPLIIRLHPLGQASSWLGITRNHIIVTLLYHWKFKLSYYKSNQLTYLLQMFIIRMKSCRQMNCCWQLPHIKKFQVRLFCSFLVVISFVISITKPTYLDFGFRPTIIYANIMAIENNIIFLRHFNKPKIL